MNLPILLRPHHGLCILRFQGKGYSQAFVDRMERIVRELANDPGREICLVSGKDEICSACPGGGNMRCKPDFVAELDQRCLSKCGLQYGDVLPWSRFKQTLTETIPDVSILCAECEWKPFCVLV